MLIHTALSGPAPVHKPGEVSFLWELMQMAYEEDRLAHCDHKLKAAKDEEKQPSEESADERNQDYAAEYVHSARYSSD